MYFLFFVIIFRLDSYTKHPTFSVGLQGLAEEDLQRVVDIIQDTFESVHR